MSNCAAGNATATAAAMGIGHREAPTGMSEEEDRAEARSEVREEMNEAPFAYMDALHAHRYWDANPQGQIPPQAAAAC